MKPNSRRRLFRAAALSALLALTLAPVAQATGFGGASFHGGASAGSGFHGAIAGGGYHSGGGTGFHENGVRAQRLELRNDEVKPTVGVRGRDRDRDGPHNGHWRNGVWIWDYDINAYDDAWNYYCDPASPGYDPAYCSGD